MMVNLTCRLIRVVAIAGFLCSAESHADLLKPREVDKIPHAAPDQILSYGNDPSQFGELRVPAGKGPFPVAIVIHGGCWMKFADLLNTAPMADALRNGGVATWNIEYRRVDQQGGGWPGTFHDIGAAADHLRTLAGKYKLDLDRVIAVGHSAGGHLALWMASRHGPSCNRLSCRFSDKANEQARARDVLHRMSSTSSDSHVDPAFTVPAANQYQTKLLC